MTHFFYVGSVILLALTACGGGPTHPDAPLGEGDPQGGSEQPTLQALPGQPPVEQPPTEQPPTEQPPTEQPLTEQPPTEQPPTTGGELPPTSVGLWSLDFSESALGQYTAERVQAEWPGTKWASPDGRVTVEEEDQNRFIRVRYPTGGVGPQAGGAQWWVNLDGLLGGSFDELYLAYRVRFREGFDFARGGKLPGLLGGAGNTGSGVPSGTDGWSARMMWRTGGSVVQYVYYPDQRGNNGEDLAWSRTIEPGTWITVEHRIVMNTPGSRDGIVQAWYNGQLALDRKDMRYRDVDSFAIDGFYVSTFFGGADSSWAPTRDEHIDFDDFVLSEHPITH